MVVPPDGARGGGAGETGVLFPEQGGEGRPSSSLLHFSEPAFPCKVETTGLPTTKVEMRIQEVTGLRWSLAPSH